MAGDWGRHGFVFAFGIAAGASFGLQGEVRVALTEVEKAEFCVSG